MNKKIIFVLFLGLLAISGLAAVKVKNKIKSKILGKNHEEEAGEVVLFYGSSCPHCKIVEDWLWENPEVVEKSGLIDKEVYENQKNGQELGERAEECQEGEGGGVGVPFLYDKGKCIIGDQPIIDYLKENYQ